VGRGEEARVTAGPRVLESGRHGRPLPTVEESPDRRGAAAVCGHEVAQMPQIFHRSFNVISKVSILGAVFILAGLGWLAAKVSRSSYVTGAGVVRSQPVPFSHDHHVSGLGIDCRYCHTSVEKSAFAGIPSTEICMN